MGSCSYCKISPTEPLKSCVCQKVSYCSKECQAKDWKSHKPSCPPFIIRESHGKGRGLFTTNRIKEGQVILEEYPLFTWNVGMSFNEFKTTHFPKIDANTKAKIFKLNTDEEAEGDEESKIYRIICGYGVRICREADLYSDTMEAGLYNTLAFLNHSCVANATTSWVKGDFRRQQVRAIMTMAKDQEIMVSYRDEAEFLYGVREFRRQYLLDLVGFLCQCTECSLDRLDLEENKRMRAEIREKKEELEQLRRGSSKGSDRRGFVMKDLKLSQQRVELVQNLNIRARFVAAMIEFYQIAVLARLIGISCENDPSTYKQEAWKYAQMFGDCYIQQYKSLLAGNFQ